MNLVDYFKINANPDLELQIAELITREFIQNEKYGVSAPVFLEGWEFYQGDASDEQMLAYASKMNINCEPDEDGEYDFSEVLGSMTEEFEEQLEKDIVRYFGSVNAAFDGIDKEAGEKYEKWQSRLLDDIASIESLLIN